MMETAAIGHNQPPTPFEAIKDKIESLHEEAAHWLDGDPIDSQELADGVSNLINMLREAKTEADNLRKEENKPFDEGKAEVQARYAPLIADTKAVKGKAISAIETCKKALEPWLDRLDREQREAAAEAKRIADEKAREAQEAARTASPDNLIEKEVAEAKIKDAKRAANNAKRAEKQTAKSGTVGRSVSLRTSWEPVLTDAVAAARYYWGRRRTEIEDLLVKLAEEDVRSGQQDIPGFDIVEKRKAV